MRRKEMARPNLETESTRTFFGLLTARECLVWHELDALYRQIFDQEIGVGVWRGLRVQMGNSDSMCVVDIHLPLVEGSDALFFLPTMQLRWHLVRFAMDEEAHGIEEPFIGAVMVHGTFAHGPEEEFGGDKIVLEGIRLKQMGGFYVTDMGESFERIAKPLSGFWESVFVS